MSLVLVVALLIAGAQIALCHLDDLNQRVQVDDRIREVRSTQVFIHCWVVPEFGDDLRSEDLTSALGRLKACEQVYNDFLLRKLEHWGLVTNMIHHWLEPINEELNQGGLWDILVSRTLNDVPRLRLTLRQVHEQLLASNEEERENHWLSIIGSNLERAFFIGQGICLDLFLPPMNRMYELLRPLANLMLDELYIEDLFIQKLINDRDPGGFHSPILLIYLIQHICNGQGNVGVVYEQENGLMIYSQMDYPISLNQFMSQWGQRTLWGRSKLNDVSDMILLRESLGVVDQRYLDENIWHDFVMLSNMMIDNCIKTMLGFTNNFQARLDQGVDRKRAFAFYKTSWELLDLIRIYPLDERQSILELINIRHATSYNDIDRFFLASSNPEMVHAYRDGTGVCLAYKDLDLYDKELNVLALMRTLDSIMSIRGFRPQIADRLVAFYLLWKICETARMIPLN